MRKAISGITELIGTMLVILGFVVCMCETADFSNQLSTMVYGMIIIVAGAIICFLGTEGGCEYGG